MVRRNASARRYRAALSAGLALVLLGGCSGFPPWAKKPDDAEALQGTELSILADHLVTMRILSDGNSDEQIAILDVTREAAAAVPTSSRKLRLALALAVPGHPSSSAAEAYRLLTELLGAPEALLSSERQLAAIQLTELQQRMILEAQIAKLGEQAQKPPPAVRPPAAVPRRSAEDIERLRMLEELNNELTRQLAEARAKLEAVTAIESDVTRRDENGDPPR